MSDAITHPATVQRETVASGAPARGAGGRPPGDAKVRFMAMVERVPSGCWQWRGKLKAAGTGQFRIGRHKVVPAHRAAYELFIGTIPPRMVVHRTCGNGWCVAPAHLEVIRRWQLRHRKGAHGPVPRSVVKPASACFVSDSAGFAADGVSR